MSTALEIYEITNVPWQDKAYHLLQHAKDLEAANQLRKQAVYAWLGYWRDKMPDEAVSRLQEVLGPLTTEPSTL